MYDYIISGGGCAGLSLAYYMQHPALQDKKILILDTEAKTKNDKTWCFWTDGNIPFLAAQHTHWENIQFKSFNSDITESISPLRYSYVNSLEFYKEVLKRIQQNPNVTFKYEQVHAIYDTPKGVEVHTEHSIFEGKWAFNSIIPKLTDIPEHTIFLKQHFVGWRIVADYPIFDPAVATLMDFRVVQKEDVRFVYILPFTEREALVEFTVFSQHAWTREKYHRELSQYIQNELSIRSYHIKEEEFGIIPMTNYSFARKTGKHIINIGTSGGFTKPTTGYTFKRIQEDTQKIAESIIESGHPHYSRSGKWRYQFYDNLLLYIIQKNPQKVHYIFNQLFRNNSIRKILRFLAEDISFIQDLSMLVRLPWTPFFQAIWKYYILNMFKLIKTPIKFHSPSEKDSITFVKSFSSEVIEKQQAY